MGGEPSWHFLAACGPRPSWKDAGDVAGMSRAATNIKSIRIDQLVSKIYFESCAMGI